MDLRRATLASAELHINGSRIEFTFPKLEGWIAMLSACQGNPSVDQLTTAEAESLAAALCTFLKIPVPEGFAPSETVYSFFAGDGWLQWAKDRPNGILYPVYKPK